MDVGALGGLCCGSRDQVLATDRWVSQAGSEQSDWEREDQAIPGTDLGEGVLKLEVAATYSTHLTHGTKKDRSLMLIPLGSPTTPRRQTPWFYIGNNDNDQQ